MVDRENTRRGIFRTEDYPSLFPRHLLSVQHRRPSSDSLSNFLERAFFFFERAKQKIWEYLQ